MKKPREICLRTPLTSSATCSTVFCRHGETALHIAAVENHLHTARLLLQRGASVNEDAL